MNKYFGYILVLFSFFVFSQNVNASEISVNSIVNNSLLVLDDMEKPIKEFDRDRDTCSNLLSEDLVDYLQTAYTIIKVGSIVIMIVMSMLDIAKTITSSKDDLMAAVVKWVKRLVILIIILMLPAVIDMIGDMIGYSDILCGIK